MMPGLLYVVGLPSYTAVGTSIYQAVFTSALGMIRHTMSGNAVILAAFIVILGSSVGTQLGAIATRYVSGLSMRYVFAASVAIALFSSILKPVDFISGSAFHWMHNGTVLVTFGGLSMLVVTITYLFTRAFREC